MLTAHRERHAPACAGAHELRHLLSMCQKKEEGGARFDSHAGRCAMECSSSKSVATLHRTAREKRRDRVQKEYDVAFAFAALSTTLTAGTTP